MTDAQAHKLPSNVARYQAIWLQRGCGKPVKDIAKEMGLSSDMVYYCSRTVSLEIETALGAKLDLASVVARVGYQRNHRVRPYVFAENLWHHFGPEDRYLGSSIEPSSFRITVRWEY